MVSTENIVTMVIVLIVSVLLPVIAYLLIWRRSKASIVNALVGAAVFTVCFVIAIATSLLASMLIASPVILVLVLSLRAGLVEEFGRFVAFKWLLKKSNTTGDALMYGVGHGGIEVILVFSLSILSSIILAITANSGALEATISAVAGQDDSLNAVVAALADETPLTLSLGLFERIVALCLHISLSVIVFCAVRQRKWFYLVLAITLHTLVNSSIALLYAGFVNVWTLESILAAATVCVAVIAWHIVRGYRPMTETEGDSQRKTVIK
jgi:uncharacterized membrane protein YhfC